MHRAYRNFRRPPAAWRALILLASALGLLAAGTALGASVEGQVFEVANAEAPASRQTRVPSADAYVVVHWTGVVPRPGHAGTVCLHAAVGKTDEHGRFKVSGSWATPNEFPVIRRDPAVAVYKPGFDQQSFYGESGGPVVRTLVRSKLPVEHRIAVLAAYAEYGCRDHVSFKTIPLGDPQRVAAGYYRALYDEALALGPVPPSSRHHLDALREMAGVPRPPDPPWEVRIIRPRGVQPAAPVPPAPVERP